MVKLSTSGLLVDAPPYFPRQKQARLRLRELCFALVRM
jgi:hypothetical protein